MITVVAIEVLVLVAILVAASLWPARGSAVERFAADSGIRATAANRPYLAWYLTTGRRPRPLLVIAALFLPDLVLAAAGAGADRWAQTPLSWQLVFAAGLAGTLGAELTLTRPAGPRHTASLVPREPAAYLGRVLRWGPTAAGLAVAGLAPATARWILRRPQPVAADDLVIAGHAVRAASVQLVAAVATIMGLLNLVGGLALYARPFDGPIDPVLAVAVAVLLAGAWVAWGARRPGEAPIVRALRAGGVSAR